MSGRRFRSGRIEPFMPRKPTGTRNGAGWLPPVVVGSGGRHGLRDGHVPGVANLPNGGVHGLLVVTDPVSPRMRASPRFRPRPYYGATASARFSGVEWRPLARIPALPVEPKNLTTEAQRRGENAEHHGLVRGVRATHRVSAETPTSP